MISLLLLLGGNAYCSEYWEAIQKRANEIYGTWNIDLRVKMTENEKNIVLEIPLYSKWERERVYMARVKFLQDGAEIIKQLEEAEISLKILEEESKIYKSTLLDGGLQGIEKYFSLKREIATTKIIINQKKRELDALCGKK